MPESKKLVIKVAIHCDKDKRNALKAVSGLSGIESIAMDNDNKMTIVGAVDPVCVVKKLKKWHTDILTVGPAKEEKKPEPPKKGNEDAEKKRKEEEEAAIKRWIEFNSFRGFNPLPPQHICFHSMEEDPNSCVIC